MDQQLWGNCGQPVLIEICLEAPGLLGVEDIIDLLLRMEIGLYI